MKKTALILFVFLVVVSPASGGQYLGQLSRNPHAPNATSGVGANNYSVKQSMNNRYSSGGPKLYDNSGNFRGNLNGNKYDSNSVSNPYGRYGSEYSSESINNPYGAGSEYRSDSPNNKYGTGLSIYDD